MRAGTPSYTSKPKGVRYSPIVTPRAIWPAVLAQDFDMTVSEAGRKIH